MQNLQQTDFAVKILTAEEAFALCRKFYELGATEKENELRDAAARKESEEYITKAETMRMLHKSENCLWKWNKKGYLKAVKQGGTVMYRKSDVMKILEGGE